MQNQFFKDHLIEIRKRLLSVFLVYFIIFCFCYYFCEEISQILITPLLPVVKEIIFTNLTEVFFTYIKLSAFTAFIVTIPFLLLQIYLFIEPALYKNEKKIVLLLFILSPILFILGAFFVFYFVLPKAINFFISFEQSKIATLTILPRISEYISLALSLIFAFGMAFQLPIILMILCLLNLITSKKLRSARRFSIVINFIIAAILTPPDIFSQLMLAIPLVLLYEISIILCEKIERISINNQKKEIIKC